MNYLKGYKPVDLNKGDLKTLDRFSDIEEKDNNITDDLTSMLGDKSVNGCVFALRNKKENKYKSIYIFKPEKDSDGNDILRFYKSVSTDDVSQETIKEFEDIVMESLKEAVSLDETWKEIIWNDTLIEPHTIRIASINLSAGLFGILFGVLLYVITGEFIFLIIGLGIGLGSGAVVSKIGEKKEEEDNTNEKMKNLIENKEEINAENQSQDENNDNEGDKKDE